MNFLRKHAVLALWVLVAGLAVRSHGAGQGRDESGFLPTASDAPPAVATPTNLAPAAAGSSGYVLDDKRRLLPGDRVSFQILEDRTNAVSLLVTESSEQIGRAHV